MNIFILSTDPIEAASYHCDQHLHKMILESAQMVSTAMWVHGFNHPGLYKPAYIRHPCTQWVCQNFPNTLWVCELALALEEIRTVTLNRPEHDAIVPIKIAQDYILTLYPRAKSANYTTFAFAGPATISIRPWPITVKYQQYYRRKHQNWLLDKGAGMSYKGRPIPEFMSDLITPVNS